MNKTFNQLKSERLKKIRALKKAGFNPYPSKTERTCGNSEATANFKKFARSKIKLAGRLTAVRGHGGLLFVDLEDESGKIQLALKKNVLGNKIFELFQNNLERGDFVQAEGKLFLTRAGEKTLEVSNIKLLAKTLHPLPEKWAGLKNEEIRYRKRYLDLLSNAKTRDRFRKRAIFINLLREFLISNKFLEVETPVLQDVAGGAIAKPFKTRHNTLKQDFYLRIAPELYLKRLLVGGYERVFEFARCFRNEGISPQHNPDYTSLEFYWAYADYEKMMRFTEKMLSKIIPRITGSLKVKFQGNVYNFKPPYRKIRYSDLIKKELKISINNIDRKKLLKIIKDKKIKISGGVSRLSDIKLLEEIYKKTIRPKLLGPLFLLDYPKEMIPLAKTKDDNPNLIATFQLIVNGWEIVKAYNELNDPKEQEERFNEQMKARKLGDKEAHAQDRDFIEALSYGMPPAAGWGMGIDRLLVILLNQKNIRDVILFPLRRIKK
ncbi:MAG: lysine--tRNA ligase [Candidatus Moranbacteria bacterium]|nr:lysine--tRNA ligase [Candidatus Moranbacteria bacterium]